MVIDLCTPVGDAMVLLDGLDTPVGPGSTVAYAAIVNEIKVQTAALLLENDALPPVITAAALVGEGTSRFTLRGGLRGAFPAVGEARGMDHRQEEPVGARLGTLSLTTAKVA